MYLFLIKLRVFETDLAGGVLQGLVKKNETACIHQGFPGQYKHLIPKLHQKGYQIYVISKPRINTKIPKWVNYFIML